MKRAGEEIKTKGKRSVREKSGALDAAFSVSPAL